MEKGIGNISDKPGEVTVIVSWWRGVGAVKVYKDETITLGELETLLENSLQQVREEMRERDIPHLVGFVEAMGGHMTPAQAEIELLKSEAFNLKFKLAMRNRQIRDLRRAVRKQS